MEDFSKFLLELVLTTGKMIEHSEEELSDGDQKTMRILRRSGIFERFWIMTNHQEIKNAHAISEWLFVHLLEHSESLPVRAA